MAKILFFFTSNYPFGNGETFIENEIDFLAKGFDKIVIISNNTTAEQTREVPANVVLERKGYELNKISKVFSLFNVSSSLYKEEKKIIQDVYNMNINRPIMNTMCQTLEKGKVWHKYISFLRNKYCSANDDLFLYSYWNNDMAFAISQYKMKHDEVKAFARMHRWDVYFETHDINYLPYRKSIFSSLDKVYSISDSGKEYYADKLSEVEGCIEISRLGVDKRGARNKSNADVVQVLTVSNMIPVKNIAVLIEALSLVTFEFHWTHIGDGIQFKELKEMADKMIPSKFAFKGLVPNNEVYTYLQNNEVDLFVNTSLSEGIPVSIMEAMSFGIPCIATAVGGTPEIVNGSNGALLPEKPSAEIIAKGFEKFYSLSADAKKQKREAAFNTWNEKYNASQNYRAFVETILSL